MADDRASILPQLIKEFIVLNDEMTALNNALREKRKRAKAVKDMLSGIMRTNNLGAINTSACSIIKKMKSTKATLSKKYLTQTLLDFFDGNAEMADKCFRFLEEHRTVKEVESIQIGPPAGGQ
jgi:hypothetical protein